MADDGGPAFPQHAEALRSDVPPGMTLRDWFAGMALSGLNASGPHDCGPLGLAFDAYRQADAMLKARKR